MPTPEQISQMPEDWQEAYAKKEVLRADALPHNRDWMRLIDPDSRLFGVHPEDYTVRYTEEERLLDEKKRGHSVKKAGIQKARAAEVAGSLPIDRLPPTDFPVWRPMTTQDIQVGKTFRVKDQDAVLWLWVAGDTGGHYAGLTANSFHGIQVEIRNYALGDTLPQHIPVEKYDIYKGDVNG